MVELIDGHKVETKETLQILFLYWFPLLISPLLSPKEWLVSIEDLVFKMKEIKNCWFDYCCSWLKCYFTSQKAGKTKEEQKVETMEPKHFWYKRWLPSFQWSFYSPKALMVAEEELLSRIRTKSKGYYVTVQLDDNTSCKIWTRVFNSGIEDKCPLVMLHGMGGGIALFALNFDEICKNRTVYAIDLPGYAKSSRCTFTYKSKDAEAQYVQSIENWRLKMNIEKFHLLGHSFGGYLSTAYTLKYPEHVSHLILAEPWGFPERPKELSEPLWYTVLFHILFKHFNPLTILRMAGPWGLEVLCRLRLEDIIQDFEEIFENKEDAKQAVSSYIYQSNVQDPTGESAFHSMMERFLWAKSPMLPRLKNLPSQIQLTAIYGADSWMSATSKEEIMTQRGVNSNQEDCFTNVEILENAGHAVYSNAQLFNNHVNKACQYSDIKNTVEGAEWSFNRLVKNHRKHG